MKPQTHLVSWCMCVLVWATSLAGAAHASSGAAGVVLDVQILHHVSGKPAVELAVAGDADRSVIDVRGGMGIGRATVRRLGASWPRELVLRLHLQGLERLQVKSAEKVIAWSIPSSAASLTIMSIIEASARTRIKPSDARFIPVKLVGEAPVIPLRNGYFEVVLRAPVLAEDSESFLLHWIDFYR